MTEPVPKPPKKATVQRINLPERAMESPTDDELPAKTEELKARLKKQTRHMATDTKTATISDDSALREELVHLNSLFHDATLAYMLKHNLPLNRETYIAMNWGPGDRPKEWTAEHEEELPEPFRTDPFHDDSRMAGAVDDRGDDCPKIDRYQRGPRSVEFG